jgi:uncharacterized integral membrane protein
MKLLSWIAGAATALVLVLFAISNRNTVSLGIEPFPFALELPLYAAVFASLILGFVLGGIGAWIGGRHSRRRARQAEAEAKRLRAELAEARVPTDSAAATTLPTLPTST